MSSGNIEIAILAGGTSSRMGHDKAAIVWNGLAVRNNGFVEPMFTIYGKSCLPAISEMLGRGSKALFKLIERGRFEMIDAPGYIARELVNFNTPDDWSALREQA